MHRDASTQAFFSSLTPRGLARLFFGSRRVKVSLLTFFFLCTIGVFGLKIVEKEMKKNLTEQLEVTLNANLQALQLWVKDKKKDAQVLASQPQVRGNILSLIDRVEQGLEKADLLRETRELIWLRKYLGAACKKYGFIGFVLMDSTGFQVGALLEEPVGQRTLAERSDFFYRALQGDTVVSTPFKNEVDLPDIHGTWHQDWPTMFAATPIRDEEGLVAGVLSFRIRPETEFSRVLEVSRFGRTGETYAFNETGTLLSNSRFNEDLKAKGFFPKEAEAAGAILNLKLRVPPSKLKPGSSEENAPLTLAVQNAIRGKPGFNVDGYPDYRGVPVVGAWDWLPELDMGVVTEIDAREAFAPLSAMNQVFLILFLFLSAVTVLALVFHARKLWVEQERNRAQQKIQVSESRSRSIFTNAMDGIVTIFENGIVESFNPAAERIFGYRDEEIVGQNVELLMPEPHRSLHNGYIQRYLFTGDARVLGFAREVPGLRKDGSVFDLELSVSQMTLGKKTLFIGIVRDISDRKQWELRLETRARQQAAVSDLGHSALMGTDLPELMNQTVHILSKTLNVEYSKILEYLPSDDSFLFRAGVGWEEGLNNKARVPANLSSQAGYTLKVNRPVLVENLKKEKRFTDPLLLENRETLSGASVLIHLGGKPFGVLEAHSPSHRFTEDDLHFFQALANVLASAMERKRSEERLRQYATELEQNNQDLEDFAFIASHDLQEPLRKVITFGDRIKSCLATQSTDRVNDYLERMRNAITKMQTFIDDLLQYSRITRINQPFKSLSLETLLREVLDNLDHAIGEVEGRVDIDTLPILETDSFMMQQLFQNLISNALKFHRKGVPPRIHISSYPEDGNWVILVRDNGIGFDNKYVDRIFKPFEQLHHFKDQPGNGMGLAICAKIVSRLGGKLRADGKPGQGATFFLTLPARQIREESPLLVQKKKKTISTV